MPGSVLIDVDKTLVFTQSGGTAGWRPNIWTTGNHEIEFLVFCIDIVIGRELLDVSDRC